jgi:addiction module HigA family antidote
MGEYVCARPIHSGEILKEEVEYRGLSKSKLAAQMGISYRTLNNILNERRPVTVEIAMLFEAVIGISPDLLINMQTDYNKQIAREDKSFAARLAEIRRISAAL